MKKHPKVVETRTVTISYEIEAEVYDDGTVGTSSWTRRTADEWYRAACGEWNTVAYRALAKALYEVALEVAPKPEEPKRHGFVGTVTTDDGLVYDVVSESRSAHLNTYTLYHHDGGPRAICHSWEVVLRYGTFTPRGEE